MTTAIVGPTGFPCACGDATRPDIDHTTHVCITAGFFDQADFAAINAAANKGGSDGQARHRR